ncbi:RNA polymerase sigma factor [Planctomycetes bacterium Poly30]|uniref:RNA polymerase sigma factor n=1 Tax=Saltatorellus ferox TaxID=2528018 RepID=A0A518ESM9_9BACT|nr:RNA polymerase sigma factor [Planctomycetes bacterium Poly30]
MSESSRMEQESGWSTEAVLHNVAWIRRMAGRLVAGPEAADELAQEVWVRSLQKPAPEGVAPRAWLMGVLHRTRTETRRSALRRREREAAVARPDRDGTGQLEHQVAIERDLVERVLKLEEPLRRTVLMRYFQGLDVQAIASREGLTESGVQSRLNRAYAALRRQLARTPGSPAGLWLAAAYPGKVGSAALVDGSTKAPVLWKAGAVAAGVSLLGVASLAALRDPRPQPAAVLVETAAAVNLEEAPVDPAAGSDEGPGAIESLAQDLTGRVALADTNDATVDAPPKEGTERPRPGLRARVESRSGAGLSDIPLRLSWGDLPLSLWSGTTDLEGYAEVPAEALRSARTLSASKTITLGILGLGVCEPVALELDDLPTETITLVLPQGVGRLEILVQEPTAIAGLHAPGPMASEAAVSLQIHRGATAYSSGLPEILRGVAGTPIVVPCVGIGHEWTVTGRVGSRHGVTQTTFGGPTVHGEVARVTLGTDDPDPTLVGWAKLDSPLPLAAGLQLRVEVFDTDGEPLPCTSHSSIDHASGRLVVGLETAATAGTPCRFRLELATRKEAAPPEEVWVTGSIPAAGDVYDLGSLDFVPASRTLHGKVVDEMGAAVPGARVLVWLASPDDVHYPWTPEFKAQGLSASDGTFVIPFPRIEGEFGVSAKVKNGIRSPILVVTDPERPIELIALAPRSVVGRLAPAPGFPLEALFVEVKESGPPSPSLQISVNPEADGSFLIDGLTSDSVDVVLRSQRQGPIAARVDDVHLTDIQPDPRLDPWQWQAGARAVDFRAFGAEGLPLPYCRVSTEGTSSLLFPEGRVRMLLPDSVEELTLTAHEHADLTLPVASIGDSVTLEAALTVSLLIDDPEGLLEGFSAQMYHFDEGGLGALRDAPDAGPTGAARSGYIYDHAYSRRKAFTAGTPVSFRLRRAGNYGVMFFRPGERTQAPDEDVPRSLRGLRIAVDAARPLQTVRVEASR